MKKSIIHLQVYKGTWLLLSSCFASFLIFAIFITLSQSSLATALGSPKQKDNDTITPTLHLPIMVKPASAYICDNVSIQLSPHQSTYQAETAVSIHISGLKPEDGQIKLQWIRTSSQLHLTDTWTDLELTWNQAGYFESTWQLPSEFDEPAPYDTSYNQEFFLAVTLQNSETGTPICTGIPSPDSTIESSFCKRCQKQIVTRQDQGISDINLAQFWNIVPGYSVTYEGQRFDNPEDDLGNPISGDFMTRIAYEAPVSICETAVIPQQVTKNNRWGYWLPAAAKPADRNGTIWTEGNGNYRFFVTSPEYNYPWETGMMGAYFQKIYRPEGQSFQLGKLGNTFDRTIVNTSWQDEYLYYPPYLLSYEIVHSQSINPFIRIDSIYHLNNVETESEICEPRPHNSEHYWYTRTALLTDPELIDEFQTIINYIGENKRIIVLTFFEAFFQNNGRPNFREDWYLMEDVGLVGIDQAHWDIADTQTAEIYLNAPFFKQGDATPHIHLRANRAYLGQPLEITPVSPGNSFPMTVTAGNCYTVAIHSTTPTPLPYDGYLEQDDANFPGLWISAMNGEPLWAENGLVRSCLPENFPAGEYRVRLRPYIDQSTSEHETVIAYESMPWSTNELWVIVP